jgi:hypothetical protein
MTTRTILSMLPPPRSSTRIREYNTDFLDNAPEADKEMLKTVFKIVMTTKSTDSPCLDARLEVDHQNHYLIACSYDIDTVFSATELHEIRVSNPAMIRDVYVSFDTKAEKVVVTVQIRSILRKNDFTESDVEKRKRHRDM